MPRRMLIGFWLVIAGIGNIAWAVDSEYRLVKDDQGGKLLIAIAPSSAATFSIDAHYVDSEGQLLWGDGGIALAVAHNPVVEDVRFTPRHEWVILWKDQSPAGDEWRAQALDSGGKHLWSDEGILLHEASGDSVAAVASVNSSGLITMAWGEETQGRTQIHLQRWGAKGLTEWGSSGALENAVPPDKNHHLVLVASGDDFQKLWISNGEQHRDWILQRLEIHPKSF